MSSSFSIIDLKDYSPGQKAYFFDANVWILILKDSLNLNSYEKVYIDFFDALNNMRATLAGMKKSPLPEIIVTPLLISEIFNTYTRIAFNYWKGDHVAKGTPGAQAFTYKRDYRKDPDYNQIANQFKSDFLAHEDILKVVDDGGSVDPIQVLKNIPTNSDFNDQYYFEFCQKNKLSLVTNDGDFLLPDVKIITNNGKLLKHK